MMTKSKMNTIRVARHAVIHQFVLADVQISVAKMDGLTDTTKTRFGTTKMIQKCVPSAGEQALKDGVLNAVLICRERAEHRVHWTKGSLLRRRHYLRPKFYPPKKRTLIPPFASNASR
jgi:hypothetical protein